MDENIRRKLENEEVLKPDEWIRYDQQTELAARVAQGVQSSKGVEEEEDSEIISALEGLDEDLDQVEFEQII